MGLTNDVKVFFTRKINGALDVKISKAMAGVDTSKVEQKARQMFVDRFGGGDLLEQYAKLEQAQKEISAKIEKLRSEMRQTVIDSGGSCSYYNSDVHISLDGAQKQTFKNEALAELYPDVVPVVAQLEALKGNVEGAILLASTERKLVNSLVSVLSKFGGDVSDIIALLPDDD